MNDIGEDFQEYKYKRSVVVPTHTSTVTKFSKYKQTINQPLYNVTSVI